MKKAVNLIKDKNILKHMLVVVLALALIAGLQTGSASGAAYAEKPRSETVYAVLGNDGTFSGATVVNCFTSGGDIVDYGKYDLIKDLSGPGEPLIEGDKITWPAAATGEGPFYYEGETKKPLPVSVSIKYYLNGSQQMPEDIAGKSGELKIEFTLKNETGTGEMDESVDREVLVPFAASVSMTLDNDKFTVLELPNNGSCVLAGSQYTLSYASFPLPEDTFSFTVFGKSISLDPINIVVLPKSPPGLDSYGDFVDVDGMISGADDMISGTDDMEGGVGDLLSALHDLKDGVKQLQSGLKDLYGGAGQLAGGTGSLYSAVKQLKASADTFYSGMSDFAGGFAAFNTGMGQLNTNVAGMATQLASLKSSAAQLAAGVDGMNTGLGGLSTMNSGIIDLANSLSADASIISALQAQQNLIDNTLRTNSASLKTLSSGVSAGASDFYTALSTTFAASVQQLSASSGQLYASCLELLGGAQALKDGCAQLAGAAHDLDGGADGLKSGTAEAVKKLPEMLSGIDDMISGVEDLKDGIAKLNDDGLKELKGKFDGLDGYLGKLSDMAAGYGSFMDERNAATSSVQFVLKTEGIGTEK